MAKQNYKSNADPKARALSCGTTAAQRAIVAFLCPFAHQRLLWQLAPHLPFVGQVCPTEDVATPVTGRDSSCSKLMLSVCSVHELLPFSLL